MSERQVAGRPSPRSSLGRASDRISFLYVQRATVHRDQNAITFQDESGVFNVPSAMIQVLLLGPGTRITHAGMSLLSESGTSVVWGGGGGVRCYAHARPLSGNTRLLQEQARLVSSTRSRLAVAKKMYSMRFPDEEVKHLTMQQLRGREGSRVRRIYREASEQYGVCWKRRVYKTGDFEASDEINQALTAAHQCLYGIVHAVIVALGLSPGLGFVHTGHENSFVHDVADLYKAETTIPLAFRITAENPDDVASRVRHAVREQITSQAFMERCVRDIHQLILPRNRTEEDLSSRVALWDPHQGFVEGGINQEGWIA
ncbi:type I-E CRISPR-associated endonuclease Cas1 [Kocuria koreensis]|jgi:CRISPR-associated protein Cas1|uniref:CRISPR-associated endonuclease Cas1 n=1 Tax=Rothia koreensis TaxID=592378 RepID=A0A7K1LI56_9MICC|nr:type I-E CRISPR-associated endonuclease Cas1e [Rothia koreensis]MUN54871.1 type I-E CRISPR-associated endonuclease Cas1 [Rothia koreensis]